MATRVGARRLAGALLQLTAPRAHRVGCRALRGVDALRPYTLKHQILFDFRSFTTPQTKKRELFGGPCALSLARRFFISYSPSPASRSLGRSSQVCSARLYHAAHTAVSQTRFVAHTRTHTSTHIKTTIRHSLPAGRQLVLIRLLWGSMRWTRSTAPEIRRTLPTVWNASDGFGVQSFGSGVWGEWELEFQVGFRNCT
jgi:hypothetical protein